MGQEMRVVAYCCTDPSEQRSAAHTGQYRTAQRRTALTLRFHVSVHLQVPAEKIALAQKMIVAKV